MGAGAWLGLVVCVVGGGAACLAWARRLGIVVPMAAGLAAQGLLTIGLYVAIGLWAPDAQAYDDLGQEFAAFWKGGPDPAAVGEGKEAFPIMLGAVYYVVGHAPAIGLSFNWVGHGLLIAALAAVAQRLDLPVRLTAWVAALFPALLFWSSFLLRETITWLLMALFLYALVGLARRIGKADLALMVASLAALLWFRGTAAIILAGVGMATLVLTSKRRTFLPRLGVAALALLVLSPRLATLLVGYTTVSDIEAKRSDLSTADTGFSGGGGAEGGEPAGLVDSVLRVSFGPYPWEWLDVGLPFGFDAATWLVVLALTVVGWWRSPRRVELLLVLLPAFALLGALMITSGNYGTMQRLRVQSSVLMIPVAAAGWAVLVERVRTRRGPVESTSSG